MISIKGYIKNDWWIYLELNKLNGLKSITRRTFLTDSTCLYSNVYWVSPVITSPYTWWDPIDRIIRLECSFELLIHLWRHWLIFCKIKEKTTTTKRVKLHVTKIHLNLPTYHFYLTGWSTQSENSDFHKFLSYPCSIPVVEDPYNIPLLPERLLTYVTVESKKDQDYKTLPTFIL